MAPALARVLEGAGHVPATVRAVPPSLEDVFIRVIRDADTESQP
jgi:hypothetical protein